MFMMLQIMFFGALRHYIVADNMTNMVHKVSAGGG